MLEMVSAVLPFFWPALVAVSAIALLSAGLPKDRAHWLWPLGVALAFGAAIGTFLIIIRDGDPAGTAPYDAVGSLIANGLPILLAAVLGVGLMRGGARPLTRAVAPLVCGALLTVPGPFIVLIVHCFSGDCL